jgi:Ethanolamine utilization protein EutJ (predicted chaperonin)
MTGEGIGDDATVVEGAATGGAEAALDGGGPELAAFAVVTGGGTNGSIVVLTGGNVEYSVATGGGPVLLTLADIFIPSFLFRPES